MVDIDIFFLYTLTVANYVAYNFWPKSNLVRFDQLYRKIYQILQYKINVVRIILEYTFILNITSFVDINIFCDMFDQIYKV
jgi:hypothetical protein